MSAAFRGPLSKPVTITTVYEGPRGHGGSKIRARTTSPVRATRTVEYDPALSVDANHARGHMELVRHLRRCGCAVNGTWEWSMNNESWENDGSVQPTPRTWKLTR